MARSSRRSAVTAERRRWRHLDPVPRPGPLCLDRRSARQRRRVVPDQHARGLARLGHVVDRGLGRLRPGVRPGRRGRSRSLSSGSSRSRTTCRPPRGGSIKGTVVATNEFSPMLNGYTLGGGQGKGIIEKINRPLLSLIDTGSNDTTVFVGRGDANGKFQIDHVPDGDYVLAFWDEDQAYLLTEANVSIVNGQAVDLGVLDVAAWWSQVYGKVCLDANRNGKCDSGRAGPRRPVAQHPRPRQQGHVLRRQHGHDRQQRQLPLPARLSARPVGRDPGLLGAVLHGRRDLQTDNQPAIDDGPVRRASTSARTTSSATRPALDWAIHPYETDPCARADQRRDRRRGPRDDDPQRAGRSLPGSRALRAGPARRHGASIRAGRLRAERPSTIPAGTACTRETTPSDRLLPDRRSPMAPSRSCPTGPTSVSGTPIDLADPYTTETWQRPTDCVARDPDGNPVVEEVLPPSTGGHDCLEAPLMASQVGDNSVGDFMQVNGNFGFAEIDHDPTTGAALARADRRCRPATTSSRWSADRRRRQARRSTSSRKRTSTSSRATSTSRPGRRRSTRRSRTARPTRPSCRPSRRSRARGRCTSSTSRATVDPDYDLTDPTTRGPQPRLRRRRREPVRGPCRKPLCDRSSSPCARAARRRPASTSSRRQRPAPRSDHRPRRRRSQPDRRSRST